MFFEYLYSTISESYLLIFMSAYTVLHIFYVFVISAPKKLKVGQVEDQLLTFDNNKFTGLAVYIMIFNMLALPIYALSSIHYWLYISIATILMATLFLSDIQYSDRTYPGNPGSIAYAVFPLVYFPAVVISIVLYLFGIGVV